MANHNIKWNPAVDLDAASIASISNRGLEEVSVENSKFVNKDDNNLLLYIEDLLSSEHRKIIALSFVGALVSLTIISATIFAVYRHKRISKRVQSQTL